MVTDLCCTTFCPKPAASDFKSDRHICHIYLILGLSTWKLQIKAPPSLSWQIGYSRINMTTRFNYLHKWDIRFTICSLRLSTTSVGPRSMTLNSRSTLAASRGAALVKIHMSSMSPQVELANTNVTQLPSGCHQKLYGRRLPCRQECCSDSASLFFPGKRSNTSSQGNTTDTASLLTILAERSCPRTIQNPNN